MKFVKSKYRKKALILLLLSFGMIFANYGFLSLNFPLNFNSIIKEENINVENKFDDLPKISSAPTSFNSNGEEINLTLHQSITQTGIPLFEIINASDYDNNTFSIISPSVEIFSSTFSKISVEDIYAPNATLIVEDYSGPEGDFAFSNSNPAATSFIVKGDGYLENATFFCRNNHATNTATVKVVIYNSTWIGTRSEPNFDSETDLDTFDIPGALSGGGRAWRNISNQHYFLDNSKTENNTWFIGLYDTSSGNGAWSYVDDTNSGGGNTDSNDETWSYENPTGIAWNLIVSSSFCPSVDLELIVDLSPIDHIPLPTEIDLRINGTEVLGNVKGSGNWNGSKEFSILKNQLDFELTAGWWNVSCNITKIQVNYTKTDLSASAEFTIAGSGQIVEWNVTRTGGLNYFDSRFSNYQINFTIPDTWDQDTIKVFNGSIPKTSDSTNRSLGNGYREVNVLNAGNGTFWYLTANSTNLLASIDSLDPFDFTDIAQFNATFLTEISDGIINLSVYSPALISDELNHSVKDESFTAGSVISLADWDISENVSKYGDFRVQISWNNDTAAGFREKIIRIFGETNLVPSLPKFRFNASESFDIDIFFNDTGLDAGINESDITYRLGNGAISSDAVPIATGLYRITIDCFDTDFSGYGPNFIEINASKTYYYNQSEIVQITIIGETDLDGSILKSSFNSIETFNVSIFYNDTVKDSGIFSAIRDVYVNSTPYTPITNYDYGDGNYNITITCDDDIFQTQGYGYFNLSVSVENSYYYNQSTEFIIYITGETSLSSTKFPDPSIGYFNSDEFFNITAYFEDVGRGEGISGGLAKIYVKELLASSYQEYTPVIIDPLGAGYYNITVDCGDPIFNPYGKYNIKINITKSHYYTAEVILGEIIIGNTTLTILDPISLESYVEDEIFDIMIEYEDHTLTSGITGADITYTINGTGYRSDNILDNLDGTYNITIDAGDADFGNNFRNLDIIIRANKTNYINLTRILTFERQILTQITPFNNPPLVEVMKGINVTYTFNYSDTSGNPIVEYDNFQRTSPFIGFQYHLHNDGVGNYTLDIDTSNVGVTGTPFKLNFSISVFGNQSQDISLTILVTIKQTSIEIESWNDNADFARSTWTNVSIDFYFNDTTNIAAIDGLLDSDIIIKDYYAGTTWQPGFELFNRAGPGNYKLNISTIGVISGLYTLQLNISKYPDFNWSLAYIEFYLRGNFTQLNLISYSYSDPEIALTPTGLGYNFTIFEGSDTTIVLNLTDLEYGNNIVLGVANSYTATYLNLVTSSNGALSNSFQFTSPNHVGTLTTSLSALIPGRYLINITLSKTNYEDVSFNFNLTVIAKYQTNLTVVFKPTSVIAGDSFRIVVQADFFNGIGWVPLQNADITMTPIFDGVPSSEVQTKSTNSTGQLFFDITIRRDAITMNITLELPLDYDYLADSMVVFEISVIPPSNGLEDLLPFIIIIGAALIAAGGSVGVYRGVIVPKKREKQRILTEVKTIFDDAINLEHILVLYKGTGTCIFFKSYGSEQINPELIGGFLSAVSSFGKEMATQEALNEISYGDKMLLLADGALIRVALVLGKNASLILRRHLKEFIGIFEKTFNDILPKWRGQLNHFRNAGTIVDEILNTSIILPHQISYDFNKAKDLKNPHSKEVLKIAQSCCEEAEREFFFIATLLKEVADRTNKDTAEIFMGIKELRDKKILIPIEISAIGELPVSQQEINLINQKVIALPNLTNEEKQKLVNDLAQLGPIEREAYLSSLTKQQEIVTAPIKTTIGDLSVENQKAAKKGIKELLKRAKIAQSKKSYIKAVEIYQGAAMLASNWELTTDFLKIQETIRKTRIEDLKIKKANLEKEAKSAVKAKKYLEAATNYKYASKMASEIFKLGVTEMTKEVKRLTNKANEYEKIK